MCGRIDLHTPAEEIALRFNAVIGLDASEVRPGWNIAPARKILGVIGAGTERELVGLTWGFVPRWAKDLDGPKPINARSDTVTQKPMFRDAFRRRRCLIPVDGFYEWQRSGSRKLPYYFRAADGWPFAVAGLWDTWSERGGGEEGYTLHSCAMLTTEANSLMAPVHDRMPVILSREDYAEWLEARPLSDAALSRLIRPVDASALVANRVGLRVNNAANDGPDLIVPAMPESQSAASETESASRARAEGKRKRD